MNSGREIRRRIKSIAGTAQITKAMQMVAASKMRKAQHAALTAIPFARALYRIQRHATASSTAFTNPLLETRAVRRRAVVLIGADNGLCGALNSNVCRLAAEFDPDTALYIAAGRKAAQFVVRTRRRLIAEFPYGDSPKFAEARGIAALARDLFLKKEVDEVRVVTTRFVNTLTQEPVCLEFLPIGEITGLRVPGLDGEGIRPPFQGQERLFEPSPEAILSYLLPRYLNISIYFFLLHAKASEQSARMVSMKNATDSAENLIHDLTLEYNKLRQGSITTELLEIAGGQAG